MQRPRLRDLLPVTVRTFCEIEPTHRPGSVQAYQAITSGFVLAEIIRRVTGENIRDFLTARVRDPLKMKHFNYGVAPEQLDRVLMMPIPLSVGFMLGGRTFGFYGPRTANAFGHLGFTNVIGTRIPRDRG